MTINIFIVDDHLSARQVFSSYLSEDPEISVIDTAGNGKELIDKLAGTLTMPDVILLDLEMPVMDGHETLQHLKEYFASVKVIMFSTHYSDYLVSRMLVNGASAYMPKSCDIEELIFSIKHVHKEGFYFNNNSIPQRVLSTIINDNKLERIIFEDQLSQREIDVIKEICDDKDIKQIANILHISENTVKHHRKNIFKKTNSKSIVSLVKFAIKSGIIRP